MLNNNQRFVQISDILVEFYDLLDQHNEGYIELTQEDLDFIELGLDSLTQERLQLQAKLMDFPRPENNFFMV